MQQTRPAGPNKLGLVAAMCVTAAISINVTPIASAQTDGDPQKMAKDAHNGNTATMESALLQPWPGPYGGVPPWHLVRADEFVEGFQTAIEMAHADIDAITANTDPATFENTIAALESVGEPLTRLQAVFGVHSSNLNVGPMPDVQRQSSRR